MAAPLNNNRPPLLSLGRANAHRINGVVSNNKKVETKTGLLRLPQIGILPPVIPSTASITGNFAAAAKKNATMPNVNMPNATMPNVKNGGRRRSRHAKKTRRNKRHAKKTRRNRKH